MCSLACCINPVGRKLIDSFYECRISPSATVIKVWAFGVVDVGCIILGSGYVPEQGIMVVCLCLCLEWTMGR